MFQRYNLVISFVRTFITYAGHIRALLVSPLLLLVLGGIAVSILEDIKLGDAIYFSFVTGLTIGYGDIAPVTIAGRIVSIAIGAVGMLFTGITVAVSTRALADTIKAHKAAAGEETTQQ